MMTADEMPTDPDLRTVNGDKANLNILITIAIEKASC